MTVDRLALLALVFANGVAGVFAAGAVAAGLPLWSALLASAVVAGCGGVLIMLRSWGDAAPLPPHG